MLPRDNDDELKIIFLNKKNFITYLFTDIIKDRNFINYFPEFILFSPLMVYYNCSLNFPSSTIISITVTLFAIFKFFPTFITFIPTSHYPSSPSSLPLNSNHHWFLSWNLKFCLSKSIK